MRKIVAYGGLTLGLSVCALFSAACAQPEPENTGSISAEFTLGFRELKAQDATFDVRGASGARLDLKRDSALSYAVSYVSPSGARSTLLLPSPGRINPVVDARTYGDKTLACVNSFAAKEGTDPRVECFLLNAQTGETIARQVVANAWLRTMPESGGQVYLSPGNIAHFEEDGRLTCRALSIDPSGSKLVYDPVTATACQEAAVQLPRERVRGMLSRPVNFNQPLPAPARSPQMRTKSGTLPGGFGMGAGSGSGSGTGAGAGSGSGGGVGSGSGSGAGPSTNVAPPVDDVSDVTGDDVSDVTGEEEASGCGGEYPESDYRTTRLGPPNLPGLDGIASGFTKPDWWREGYTLGARLNLTGEQITSSDVPMCLNSDWHKTVSGGFQLSVGPVVGTIGASWTNTGSNCSTLECRGGGRGSYACGDPGGNHENDELQVDFAIGGSIPLDTVPQFRPFCGLGVVSCNIDLMGSGGYWKKKNNASGKSSCGSGCGDGRATSYDETRKSAGFTGAAEIEFGAGWLLAGVNGRAGMQYEFKYIWGEQNETTCTNTTSSNYSCTSQLATAYASGCVGTQYVNYCFDWNKILFRSHSGDCPPFEAPSGSGTSAGTGAGNACMNQADEFWTSASYYNQCVTCCNALPIPPADVQDGASFDADCKAVCDQLR